MANTQNLSQLIELALLEYIQHYQSQKNSDLRDLVGKVSIDPDYDYKKMRIGDSGMMPVRTFE